MGTRENCQKVSSGAQVIMAPSNFTAVKIKKEKITPIKAPRVDSLVSSTLQRVKAEKKSPKPVKAVQQEVKRLDNLAGHYSANAPSTQRDFKPKIKSEFRNGYARAAPYRGTYRRPQPSTMGWTPDRSLPCKLNCGRYFLNDEGMLDHIVAYHLRMNRNCSVKMAPIEVPEVDMFDKTIRLVNELNVT